MAEFKPAPTAAPETQPGKISPAPTAPEKKAPEKKIHVDTTGDPEEALKKLAEAPKVVSFSVAGAKHRIGKDGQKEQEVLEQESRVTARAKMTEQKEEWSDEDKTLKDKFQRAMTRWWRHGVQSLNTYVQEKNLSHQLLAEAGVQMKALPYEFLRNIRNLAQEGVNVSNDQTKADRDTRRQGMNRRERTVDRLKSVKNIRQRIGQNQRELAAREVSIVQNLRKVVDPRFSGDPEVQRFAVENAALVASYKDVLRGDFQASEGLARRLGNEFSNDAIRTAVGEKRATDIVLEGEKAKPIADFFKNEVIIPMLVEGLANGGQVNQDRLLELRTKVQEKFFTKEFAEWRNSLPSDVQEKFALSMSYGTDIIPAIEKVLLPQLMAVKDHLQSSANLQEYVDQMVLKVNVGTLQAGEQGSVGETKREAKYARALTNERVVNLHRVIQEGNGPEPVVPGVYQSALDSASARLQVLGMVGGHNTAGLVTGAALWAAQYGFTKSANLLMPFVGGSLAAGIVRGIQERSRFTREYEQHGREAARGVTFDDEAKRRNEMKNLEMPMVDIQADVLNPLGQTLDQLRRGQVSTDVLNRAFGLLADARVRRGIMDENLNIELYRTSTDQSLDAQKTELELRRDQTMAELRKLAVENPAVLSTYARTLGIDFKAGDSLDTILNPLEGSLRANIQQGTEIENQFQNTLTTGVDSDSNIDNRNRAMRKARVLAQLKQGGGTAAAALVGGGLSYVVTEEAATLALRAWEHTLGNGTQVQPSFIEKNLFGMEDAQRTVEGFTTVGKHPADIMGHRVDVPDGTHWVENNGKFDLVLDNRPDQILINDAYFDGDTLRFDGPTSMVGPDAITERFDTRTVDQDVFGENGKWNEWATETDHREYYGYDTKASERNELKFHTLRQGDAVVLQMQDMEFSEAKGLNPSRLDIQQAIERHEAQIALSLPGELNNSIVIDANDTFQRDGKWVAGLKLDPNSTELITLGNGDTISQKDLFNLLINKDVYNTLPQGDFASEVSPQERDLFQLGGRDGNGRGQISAGRLIEAGNGEKVWQSFATIFGTGKTPDIIPFEESFKVTEITAHIEASEDPWDPFGIPIPAPWPRRPLEAGNDSKGQRRLDNDIPGFIPSDRDTRLPYADYGYWSEMTPEKAAFYKSRFSETLQNDPNANLDFNKEAEEYFRKQSPEYIAELESYLEQDGMHEPMHERANASVVMPVYDLGEGQILQNTLEQYFLQVDKNKNKQAISPDKFELVLFLNHPKAERESIERQIGRSLDSVEERAAAEQRVRDGKPEKYDTDEVIRQFQHTHPELKIRVMRKEFEERQRWPEIIKPLYDIALLRAMRRPKSDGKDPVIIANDADVTTMTPTYLRDILQEMDMNEILASRDGSIRKIDGIVGKIDLPNEGHKDAPGFFASYRLFQYLDALNRRDNGGAITQGRNTVLRASTYAAIGGVNNVPGQSIDAGADTELGRMVALARQSADSIKYLNRAWLESDPRRERQEWEDGKPISYAWDSWNDQMFAIYGPNWKQRFPNTGKLDKDRLESDIYFEMQRWGLQPNSQNLTQALHFLGFKPEDYHIGKRKVLDPRKGEIEVEAVIIDNLDNLSKYIERFSDNSVDNPRWKALERNAEQVRSQVPRHRVVDSLSAEYLDYEEFNRLYADLFFSKEYPWKPDPAIKDPVVIDLGGHIGMSVMYWKHLRPDAKITVVEANDTTAEVLEHNVARNNLKDVRVVKGAAADHEGTVPLYMPKEGVDFRWGDFVGGRPVDESKYNRKDVPAVKVSNLITGPVDLLKMDIEGSEGDVLREVRPKLHLVKEIMMEFHNDPANPKNSLAETLQILREEGYDFEVREWNEPVDVNTLDVSKQFFLTILAKRPTGHAFPQSRTTNRSVNNQSELPMESLESKAAVVESAFERYGVEVNERLRTSGRRDERFGITPDALAEIFEQEGMVFNGAELQNAQVSYANNRITVTGTLHFRGKQIPVRKMVLGRERINENLSVMELDLDRNGLSLQERALVMVESRRVRSQIHQRMHDALNAQIDEDNVQDAWRVDEIRLGNEMLVDYRRPAVPLGPAPDRPAGKDANPPVQDGGARTRPPEPPAPPPPVPVRSDHRAEQVRGANLQQTAELAEAKAGVAAEVDRVKKKL